MADSRGDLLEGTAESPTAADTVAFGARLGADLRAGDVVVLTGPLGAGKTALVQGIGAGLGVGGAVTGMGCCWPVAGMLCGLGSPAA